MSVPKAPARIVAPRVTGAAHVVAATGYSLAGLRRLWMETAFRHEVVALAVGLAALAIVGASAGEIAVLLGLFGLLVAVEALNTAVECIVDHVSPEWSEAARNAKDLGSLAVMCLLVVTGLFVTVTVMLHLLV